MEYFGTIQENQDLVNKKYVDDQIDGVETHIDTEINNIQNYVDGLFEGPRYKILREVTLEQNTPITQQITATDTIYVVRYDFDLNGETLNMPTGCSLKFEGGSISGGIVAGQDTIIDGIFNVDTISGTFIKDGILIDPKTYFKFSSSNIGISTYTYIDTQKAFDDFCRHIQLTTISSLRYAILAPKTFYWSTGGSSFSGSSRTLTNTRDFILVGLPGATIEGYEESYTKKDAIEFDGGWYKCAIKTNSRYNNFGLGYFPVFVDENDNLVQVQTAENPEFGCLTVPDDMTDQCKYDDNYSNDDNHKIYIPIDSTLGDEYRNQPTFSNAYGAIKVMNHYIYFRLDSSTNTVFTATTIYNPYTSISDYSLNYDKTVYGDKICYFLYNCIKSDQTRVFFDSEYIYIPNNVRKLKFIGSAWVGTGGTSFASMSYENPWISNSYHKVILNNINFKNFNGEVIRNAQKVAQTENKSFSIIDCSFKNCMTSAIKSCIIYNSGQSLSSSWKGSIIKIDKCSFNNCNIIPTNSSVYSSSNSTSCIDVMSIYSSNISHTLNKSSLEISNCTFRNSLNKNYYPSIRQGIRSFTDGWIHNNEFYNVPQSIYLRHGYVKVENNIFKLESDLLNFPFSEISHYSGLIRIYSLSVYSGNTSTDTRHKAEIIGNIIYPIVPSSYGSELTYSDILVQAGRGNIVIDNNLIGPLGTNGYSISCGRDTGQYDHNRVYITNNVLFNAYLLKHGKSATGSVAPGVSKNIVISGEYSKDNGSSVDINQDLPRPHYYYYYGNSVVLPEGYKDNIISESEEEEAEFPKYLKFISRGGTSTIKNPVFGPTNRRPPKPYIGEIFFDITVGGCVVWNGTEWISLSSENGWFRYKVLDPDTPLSEQITESDYIYEFRYDFNLASQQNTTITIPARCILKFNGGIVRGGTLVGNGTEVQSKPFHIFDDVTFEGTWNGYAYVEWFGAKSYDSISSQSVSSTDNINSAIGSGFNIIRFSGNKYLLSNPINITKPIELYLGSSELRIKTDISAVKVGNFDSDGDIIINSGSIKVDLGHNPGYNSYTSSAILFEGTISNNPERNSIYLYNVNIYGPNRSTHRENSVIAGENSCGICFSPGANGCTYIGGIINANISGFYTGIKNTIGFNSVGKQQLLKDISFNCNIDNCLVAYDFGSSGISGSEVDGSVQARPYFKIQGEPIVKSGEGEDPDPNEPEITEEPGNSEGGDGETGEGDDSGEGDRSYEVGDYPHPIVKGNIRGVTFNNSFLGINEIDPNNDQYISNEFITIDSSASFANFSQNINRQEYFDNTAAAFDPGCFILPRRDDFPINNNATYIRYIDNNLYGSHNYTPDITKNVEYNITDNFTVQGIHLTKINSSSGSTPFDSSNTHINIVFDLPPLDEKSDGFTYFNLSINNIKCKIRISGLKEDYGILSTKIYDATTNSGNYIYSYDISATDTPFKAVGVSLYDIDSNMFNTALNTSIYFEGKVKDAGINQLYLTNTLKGENVPWDDEDSTHANEVGFLFFNTEDYNYYVWTYDSEKNIYLWELLGSGGGGDAPPSETDPIFTKWKNSNTSNIDNWNNSIRTISLNGGSQLSPTDGNVNLSVVTAINTSGEGNSITDVSLNNGIITFAKKNVGGGLSGIKLNGTSQTPDNNGIVNIPVFNRSAPGLTPNSGGSGTTKYLREDGTWQVPPDTKYTSKNAVQNGTADSLVKTGEKYTWNHKSTVTINEDNDNNIVSISVDGGTAKNVLGSGSLENYVDKEYLDGKNYVTSSALTGYIHTSEKSGLVTNTGEIDQNKYLTAESTLETSDSDNKSYPIVGITPGGTNGHTLTITRSSEFATTSALDNKIDKPSTAKKGNFAVFGDNKSVVDSNMSPDDYKKVVVTDQATYNGWVAAGTVNSETLYLIPESDSE